MVGGGPFARAAAAGLPASAPFLLVRARARLRGRRSRVFPPHPPTPPRARTHTRTVPLLPVRAARLSCGAAASCRPRIRDLVNEEVAAFCAANSRITATQLKGLQLSVAAKVSEHPDAKRALRLRSPHVGTQRSGWRAGGASGANGSRSRALAAAGDTALRYGLVPPGTGGAGQPPLTARGRMEKTRGMAEEVARRREAGGPARRGGASRPGSAAPSGRVPWRGAAEQSPGALLTEEETKGSARGQLDSRGSRRSAGSRRGSPRTGAGASAAGGQGGARNGGRHHAADNSSDDDSADEAGSGDDHVSVESEEDSEGEGETRVVRYGRCALRTHLHRRGDEPTRKRLGRVERAVVRDPNPEVVEGIVTEALMKRKAKEDAARLKARQEEFRTLLKQQEEEKKLAAALDADEDERFGEMLREKPATPLAPGPACTGGAPRLFQTAAAASARAA